MITLFDLQHTYLDYVNNYLTVDRFAADNRMTTDEAQLLIQLGRKVHERLVAESLSK